MIGSIEQASSLREVVAIINKSHDVSIPYFGGTDLRSPEQLAAAYTADEESFAIAACLEILEEAGAKFNRPEAYRIACEARGEY